MIAATDVKAKVNIAAAHREPYWKLQDILKDNPGKTKHLHVKGMPRKPWSSNFEDCLCLVRIPVTLDL